MIQPHDLCLAFLRYSWWRSSESFRSVPGVGKVLSRTLLSLLLLTVLNAMLRTKTLWTPKATA